MIDEMINIACVLQGAWPQNAPALGEDYVRHLYDRIKMFMPPVPWRFVCFTDRKVNQIPGVPTRPLPNGLYGWFSKLYAFSPEAFPTGSRVLYFDLDTVPIAPIEPLTTVDISKPVFLWDEYHPLPKRAASGIMSFRSGPEMSPIWNQFVQYLGRPPPYGYVVRNHPMKNNSYWQASLRQYIGTDEEWLHQFVYPADKHRLWQDLLPPRTLLSYKWDILGVNRKRIKRAKNANTCLYFFHGRPRPHEVKAFWTLRSSGQILNSTEECAPDGEVAA